ncbi:hypothetical protein KTH73_04055 [Acinetobacter courvalinii]|uniref:hypothetical protein n=1 Tax=Acinetobacter courvalinii TaxID=280147 RepID=UPI0021CD9F72|nr:hypothetical protein [Acinetobacter courvalinii]MCU4389900.1 hypothetical protein [Acinetobacter courvalinii]
MFTYEGGIFVAFLLWLFGFVRVILLANSKTQRNLKLIGKRMSYNLGMIVDYDYNQESLFWKISKFLLFHIVLSLPFILLSWVYVLFVCGSFAYVFYKDIGAPQAIKEFRWKIRNLDMSFDQMIKETMKIDEQSPDDFEKIKKEMVEYLQQKKLNNSREIAEYEKVNTNPQVTLSQSPPLEDFDSIPDWVDAVYSFYGIKFPEPYYITSVYGNSPVLEDYDSIKAFENDVRVYAEKIKNKAP